MKRLYFFIVASILCYECKAQSKPDLEHVKIVNKANLTKVPSLSDSLQAFTNSLYANIMDYVENNKDGFNITQFSFCVKINNKGTVDSVLISDNVDYRLRIHISKIQTRLNYTNLIKQANLKKWYNTNLIFPFTILYNKDNSHQNFIEYQDHLKKAFSFSYASANSSSINGIVMEPTILFFSILCNKMK